MAVDVILCLKGKELLDLLDRHFRLLFFFNKLLTATASCSLHLPVVGRTLTNHQNNTPLSQPAALWATMMTPYYVFVSFIQSEQAG